MEKSTTKEDEPPDVKKKAAEEMKFVMDDGKPIGEGIIGYAYRIKSTAEMKLGASKVIKILKDLFLKEKDCL